VFLLQIMFGVLGVLLRLPRGLLLGLVLFVLGLVLLELVNPTPRTVPQRAAVTQLRATPPPAVRPRGAMNRRIAGTDTRMAAVALW